MTSQQLLAELEERAGDSPVVTEDGAEVVSIEFGDNGTLILITEG